MALGGGKQSLANNILLVLAGSVLIALSAQIAIPLPFTPVPVTGQTFAILMVGMALGSTRGALAVVAYLMEGAAGLPVFAGGTGGMAPLMGPTAGFLFGFVPAAFVTGFLAEGGWDRNPVTTALAMLAGNAVIYIPGLIVLGSILGTTPSTTLEYGFLPFYLGDLVKLALAAAMMPLAWKFLAPSR
ncbi:MAG: biotin transporter BioY [Alphaproteobacteria bacterium]|nr:biotin transporter BioY [Alphaproteobacteria bacterium]